MQLQLSDDPALFVRDSSSFIHSSEAAASFVGGGSFRLLSSEEVALFVGGSGSFIRWKTQLYLLEVTASVIARRQLQDSVVRCSFRLPSLEEAAASIVGGGGCIR